MSRRIVLRRDDEPAPKKSRKRRRTTNQVRSNSLPEDKDRLNLQMDRDLKKFAQDWCKRNNTTLTQAITDMWVRVRKSEQGDGVDQI